VVGGLEILFEQQLIVVDDQLTFGRSGQLVLDAENQFLHRVVGEFVREGQVWHLYNRGAQAPLRLFASDGMHAVLPPSGRTVLSAPTGTISCAAGVHGYDLTYRLHEELPESAPLPASGGDETAIFGVPLTAREIDFMLEFAKPALTNSGEALPTYAQVAHALDVRPKTVDATLHRLRRKLTDAGVPGIQSTGELLTHLLATGKITYGQLVESGHRIA